MYFGFNVLSMCFTAKDKGEKKLFGYSFVPLMQEDGRTLPDGTHELIIHKVRLAYLHQKKKNWTERHVAFAGFMFCTVSVLIFIKD